MTSHDYQYRRRRTRREQSSPRPPRRRPGLLSRVAVFNLFFGIAFGFALALAYAWVLHPVEIDDSTPGALQPQFQSDYILLIAETYSVDQNLAAARARLDTLQLSDPTGRVAEQAEQMIAAGANHNDIRRVVGLALALDVVTPVMEPYLP
ncbi:MAG: hypothetical protein ACE5FI_06835 [Anaerolineales bacterium]